MFQHYPSSKRKYCSKACNGKAHPEKLGIPETRYTATCEQCGRSFEAWPTQTRGRFCSLRCYGDWQSVHRRGAANPKTGGKFGRAKHLPPPLEQPCVICGTLFLTKPSHAARRQCCSQTCMGALHAKLRSGPNSATWLGGHEPYYGPSWRAAQRAVRRRDRVCQRCGKTPEANGRALDVHHLKPRRAFPRERHAEANALSNLVGLCHGCHLLAEWETNRRAHRASVTA